MVGPRRWPSLILVRILIVDDSPGVRRRLAAIAREVDAVREVEEAGSASEALALARARPPDLVVLDVHMPGGGGLPIVSTLKRTGALVVVVTNAVTPWHRQAALAQGADHFLDKSSEADRLREIVRALAGATALAGPGG